MLKTYSPPCPDEAIDLSDLYLIKEVKNGNGDVFRILAERYDYIISYNISKLYASGKFNFNPAFAALRSEKEDLFQECRIVLYKAVKYYDFKKNVKFSTYANICVKNHLISLCRKYCKTEKYPGCDLIPLDEIRGEESVRYDRYFAVSDYSSFLGLLNINVLTALEKNVLMMYAENKSYKYMARILNKSIKSIDNAVCRIKSKLRPYAEYFIAEY